MNNYIKWLRLQELCEAIIKARLAEVVSVSLHGSTTALPANVRSAVERRGDQVNIIINLTYAKCVPDVIDSLAHEISHVTLQTEDCKTMAFRKTWRENRSQLTALYEGRS